MFSLNVVNASAKADCLTGKYYRLFILYGCSYGMMKPRNYESANHETDLSVVINAIQMYSGYDNVFTTSGFC